jgi:hypothetical protein
MWGVASATTPSRSPREWWTSLAAADRDGTFLYGFTAFIVSGTKA